MPPANLVDELLRAVKAEIPVRQLTVVEQDDEAFGRRLLLFPVSETNVLPKQLGSLGEASLDESALALLSEATATCSTSLQIDDRDLEVFVEVFDPLPKLIVVGAVHVAIHLVHFAQRLGFHTIVLDARSAFATPDRFPHADELIVRWPADQLTEMALGASSYCVFLTHDPKLDDPALKVALEAGARYVGALGSKRTHAKRVVALRELDVDTELIERIHAPIGLDLGGRKPEEIALSIIAEIVRHRHRG